MKMLACGTIFGSSLSDPAGTINGFLDLFIKGTPEPHKLQKDF